MSRQVLLIGKNGQLGYELNHTLLPLASVTSLDMPEFDLSKPAIVRSTVQRLRPNLIINAAAYTDVEKAEEEPELAYAINGIAPGILAEEANSVGARLVHYSTDYVFDGSKASPRSLVPLPKLSKKCCFPHPNHLSSFESFRHFVIL